MKNKLCFGLLLTCLVCLSECYPRAKFEDKTKCPVVKAMRNFDLKRLMGHWYVVQYYASAEEDLEYKCMKTDFTEEDLLVSGSDEMHVTMNFTYIFMNDPLNEALLGNITWQVPDPGSPAHWVHAEDTYEGIYNTYVLDTDYDSWTLLMHCAEKEKSLRYLSAFIMSRNVTIGHNVVSYLRDKLPKYDIDIQFMFEMSQNDCNPVSFDLSMPPLVGLAEGIYNKGKKSNRRKHPMKRIHKAHPIEKNTI